MRNTRTADILLSQSFCGGKNVCNSDYCDLHIHTTASDGECTPHQVVSQAREIGLKAISLCDHDTISGFQELSRLYFCCNDGTLAASGVEVIPGIEINSEWRGRELHILGYFINPDDEGFSRILETLRDSRIQRLYVILKKLRKLDVFIDISRVLEMAQGESVGRPHVAKAMVEKGYVGDIKEAFQRYLGIGKPGYAERFHLSPIESIRAIRRAKGVAIWAHPGTAKADDLLGELIQNGLQGLEVYHPEHDRELQQQYKRIAVENRLLITGGSDFHSFSDPVGAQIGSHWISYDSVLHMKQLAKA